MDSSKSLASIPEMKTSKDKNNDEFKQGITMRLLEKYKPYNNTSQVVRLKKRTEQDKAA